jgi:hypothetical protein
MRDVSILVRSSTIALVAAILMALGIANIATRVRLQQVEDGVLWAERSEGVTAVEIAPESAAGKAGIARGDVLVAVNGNPVESRAQVLDYQHRAREGTRLTYTLLRLGDQRALDITLAPVAPPGSMYFVLAAVGLFTLLVGAGVRLRRPHDQATLHFFWLCVAFFGAFTFSFNGPFDPLDWTFYWGDAVAQAVLPPLLLHFTLGFPQRPPWRTARPMGAVLPIVYLPAILLIAARIVMVAGGRDDGARLSLAVDVLDRAEPVYLFACAAAAIVVLTRAFSEITSLTGRRQLR